MPRNKCPPTYVEPRPSEERGYDVLGDWLRQIDRWVNEGGAEERPKRPAEHAPGSLEG
jgi:hypothetical protein